MKPSPYAIHALGWLSFVLLACTDVADERAERDQIVGHYRGDATRIDVDDGLAVIRDVKSGAIVLWSSAPAWSATVELDDVSPLTIEVSNLVAGSTLEATGPSGASLDVRLVGEPLPTRRQFAIDAPSTSMRLTLSPSSAQREPPYRFAVLSDIQGAIGRIQDVYRSISEESDVDFVLSAGDLTEQGTWTELQRFETELERLPIPFYSTLGNHELGTTPPAYQDVFGRANLHFHYRGTAFSLVDSGNATLSRRSLDWVDGWLDEHLADVHVFVTHYPPIDPIGVRNGSFASRAEAHELIARLAKGRVDLSLHGHVHSFYAFTLAGISAYISGGGGAIPERFDDIGRHFLVIDVEADQIERVRVVRVD